MANRRFDFKEVTPAEFKGGLKRLQLDPYTFASMFGITSNAIDKQLSGRKPLPPWYRTALALLALPQGLKTAKETRNKSIEFDHLKPELGKFPYSEGWQENTRLPDSLP